MVELVPTPFGDHITRIHRELRVQGAVYDLPRRKWFVPDPDGPDLSVSFHGRRAGNASGPAAGPHGQMAQNIVLSYLAGGRIMELKTVQVNDRLTIPRPCIDATNVGYNVEWSQELRLEDSLHEYVAGAMLVHVIRQGGFFGDTNMSGPLGDVVYDMSVGYDLAGIQSPSVRRFIESMRDTTNVVNALRLQIPAEFRALRDLDYPTALSNSVTLSTFHGCPAGEIERICSHLIADYGLNVIIKMNPPMLGREKLEHLLHDVLGYHEIRVPPQAYESGLKLDEAVDIVRRLDKTAGARGLRCGAKFSNTLEVVNHRDYFAPESEIMYMSGAPLHVITMALTADFREAVGGDCPISFSAGVDRTNFADVVACGIVPVTTCTDLLRPGGYARLPKYLTDLARDMTRLGASTIDAYILARCGDATITDPVEAGLRNTRAAADSVAAHRRYHKSNNSTVPRRIDSRLVIFDCITCDKCVPVCPNDANFTYPLPAQDFGFTDYEVAPNGTIAPIGEPRRFVIEKGMQIANYVDYCNECGNCDTFCPEYGGPFIEKPTFFGTHEGFLRHSGHDGFHVEWSGDSPTIHGRIKGAVYRLRFDHGARVWSFNDGEAEVSFGEGLLPEAARRLSQAADPHRVDVRVFHTMRLLLEGVLEPSRVNPVNVTAPRKRDRGRP
jgi:putative selenate reductase